MLNTLLLHSTELVFAGNGGTGHESSPALTYLLVLDKYLGGRNQPTPHRAMSKSKHAVVDQFSQLTSLFVAGFVPIEESGGVVTSCVNVQ